MIAERESLQITHPNSWGRLAAAAALGLREELEGTAQATRQPTTPSLLGAGEGQVRGKRRGTPDQQEPGGSRRERVVGSKRAQPFSGLFLDRHHFQLPRLLLSVALCSGQMKYEILLTLEYGSPIRVFGNESFGRVQDELGMKMWLPVLTILGLFCVCPVGCFIRQEHRECLPYSVHS